MAQEKVRIGFGGSISLDPESAKSIGVLSARNLLDTYVFLVMCAYAFDNAVSKSTKSTPRGVDDFDFVFANSKGLTGRCLSVASTD